MVFANRTSKEIKGIQGTVAFKDIFDDVIKEVSFKYEGSIKPKSKSDVWLAGMDYNPYIDTDVSLKNIKAENLKYEWQTETIIYADGSKETID